MGRGLLSGLWDVEAAIYTGPAAQEERCRLGLQHTEAVLRAARAEAERNGWDVSIAVVDRMGMPLGLVTLDGSPPDSGRCAIERAQQAAAAEPCGLAGDSAPAADARQQPLRADAMPLYVNGRCIGAIGVHGAQRSEAAQVAYTGALAGGQGG